MKKGTFTNIILVLMLIIGLSLLLYPSFSNYWNFKHQSRAISAYTEQLANIDDEQYEHIWKDAIAYNQAMAGRPVSYVLNEEHMTLYNSLLNLTGDGVMGYIEIPSINCMLPIYHTTEEVVLQVAVGHLDWTSLPTGGESTHCALSGHRGLPSARLFTDLDKLREGDVFKLYILDELLTYEVDRIKIVEPHVTEDLLIEEGKDLCTLVTCTPYGINSHRLLVRGHRVENEEDVVVHRVTSDALRVEPILIAILLFIPILMIELVLVGIYDHFQKPNQKKRY